ncbi:hypothetical protein OG534_04585 [Streptomyces sp. NBC_01294]|nr:hypothetical protein OG534_04585 [Streptomyces sp. NBC_01294]
MPCASPLGRAYQSLRSWSNIATAFTGFSAGVTATRSEDSNDGHAVPLYA